MGTHGALCKPEVVGEIADTVLTNGEVLQNAEPGRIGQAVKERSSGAEPTISGRWVH